jgi:hypothetical protein
MIYHPGRARYRLGVAPGAAGSLAASGPTSRAPAILEWEDISPPAIVVSHDGGMAYVRVHKRVRLGSRTSADAAETEFAWTETYRKRGGEWKLTSLTSTDAPAAAHQN